MNDSLGGRFKLSLIPVLFLGIAAASHEGHPERMAAIEAGLKADPGDVGLLLERAAIHEEEGRFDLGLADLAAAARIDPVRADFALLRGRLLLAAARPRAALAEIEASLLRQGQNPEALLWRGRCHRALGDAAAASRDFELACHNLPELTAELAIEKARLALLPGGGGAAAACQSLDKEMKRCPAIGVLLGEKQRIETEAGLLEEALATLDRRIGLSRAPEALLLDRSRLLRKLKRDAEAQASLQELRRLIAAWPPHLHEVPALRKLAQEAKQEP
ncbi:MAG: hypothetical protein RL095_791 [Verrucomicrobiota bacterium]|jgi:tetratricopeptide (TPR) repeat protein